MSASKQTAFDYIDEKAGVITDVSDKIWDYAELSLREYKSGDLYAKVLKEEGFTVDHPFDNIETAFRASYGSGKPVIGILAEYDALTGLSQVAGSEKRGRTGRRRKRPRMRPQPSWSGFHGGSICS